MGKLDSVNVFIFSVLKFKKWNPSLAPGYALSCLKRSDYLLGVCKEGLERLAHQLITKQQRDAVHLFCWGRKITNTGDSKSVSTHVVTIFFQNRCFNRRNWFVVTFVTNHIVKAVHQSVGETWPCCLDSVTLKAMWAVHSTVLCHPGDHTLLFCSSDCGSCTE